MLLHRISRTSRLLVVLCLLAAGLAALGLQSPPANADSAVIPVTATVGPSTANLHDLDTLNIHVDAQSPPNASTSLIYGVSARLCKGSSSINSSFGFNPTQSGNCANAPLSSGSDAYMTMANAPPYATADLSFKVGIGSVSFTSLSGPSTVTCNAANPCQLVLALAIPGGTAYKHFNLTFAAAGPSVPGTPAAPTGTPGNASVAVVWTAPGSDGGAAIDGYTVTASPGGGTCTWTAGPLTCTVGSLVNGTPYTFTVKAHNSVGFGAESAASGAVAPVAPPSGSYFHPLAPVRILDSRSANGGWNAKLVYGSPRTLQVTGANTVPTNADAVVLNVTVTGGSANSFITAFPAGGSVPIASNVNFAVGQTIPNLVTVKVGSGGQVAFANAAGSVDVIADLVGYFDTTSADRYNPVTPARILDSRTANGGWNGQLVANAPRTLQVRGAGGVPNTADSVVMNVTATGGSTNSFLTAFPAGTKVPIASNVNFAAGETIPNLVSVKIGTNGQVSLANAAGAVDVIADVVGYFDPTTGDLFHALSPARILDSRTANGGWNVTKLFAGSPRNLQVTGVGNVPSGATAVFANTTVTGGTANSFVTVYPAGVPVPNASNVNFGAGETIPNMVAVKLSGAGQISFANAAGATDVIFDVVGYFGGA